MLSLFTFHCRGADVKWMFLGISFYDPGPQLRLMPVKHHERVPMLSSVQSWMVFSKKLMNHCYGWSC